MKRPLLSAILFFLFVFFLSTATYATHNMGADLTYRCLGGLQYEITLSVYIDCQGIVPPGSYTVNANSASCSQSASVTVSAVGLPTEVSPICPSQLANTTCGTGSLPGVNEYIYRGTVTLASNCVDWVFSWSDCCRNAIITNLTAPGSDGIYVEAFLNSIAAPCNNSPTFANNPVPFICQNQPINYNQGAIDTDSDSLIYSLIDAQENATTTVGYVAGFSGVNPVTSLPAVTIGALNGTVQLNPTQLEVGVMAVLVEEYRNGVKIGSVMRDVQLVVQACGSNNFPVIGPITGLTGGLQPSSHRVEVCPGTAVSFTVTGTDADMGNTLSLVTNNGITGATFSTTGTNPVTGTFTWTPTVADKGFNSLIITLSDDGCTIKGVQSLALEVWVLERTVASPDQVACSNGSKPATLTAIGGSTFNWAVLSGDMGSLGCTTCQTQQVSPSVTTTYTVASNFVCNARDTVVVTAESPHTLVTTDDTIYCGVHSIPLLTTPSPANTYTYDWTPATGLSANNIANPLASPSEPEEYIVAVTSPGGCIVRDTVDLTVGGIYLDANPTASSDLYCNGGDSVSLYANATNGECDGYSVASIPYSPETITGTTLALSDEQVSGAVPIGFPFIFYCDTYTELYVSSNGWLSFSPQSSASLTTQALPNASTPNNIIAFAWDDLNPGSASSGPIRYQTIGTAPNRRFVLEFNGVVHFGSTTDSVNTQVILHEGTNNIDIQNTKVEPNNSGTLTQGIENLGGTSGVAISGRNAAVWTAINDAYRFVYDPGLPYSVNWHGPLGNSLGMGDSIKVTPTVLTTYYAILTEIGTDCKDTVAAAQLDVATVDAGPNQTVFFTGSAVLDATYTGPLPTPLCDDYIVSNTTYSPVTLSSPTSVTLGNDAVTSALPIGFDFDFYCNTYQNFYISSNGWISFTSATSTPVAGMIPDAAIPNNLIAFAWSDLDPADPASNFIRYETVGMAPNRQLVVDIDIAHIFSSFCTGGCQVTCQVILYETDGSIEIHNTLVQQGWFDRMTQGIENSAGNLGVAAPGRNNNTTWSATNDAYRFELRPAVVGFTWTPALGLNDPTLEDPTATPSVDTWYTVTADNGECTVIDSVLVSITPLPISLLSFEGEAVNGAAQLAWETVLEINAAFFEVEHSLDGFAFKKVGQVKAKGQNNELTTYDFVHTLPAQGYNYYRLRMVDVDGQYNYSDAVKLYFDGHDPLLVKVHPNPSNGLFHFDYTLPSGGNATLQILNLAGQVVRTYAEVHGQGGSFTQKVYMDDLPEGIYLYQFHLGEKRFSGKITLRR